ncbi:MAG: hypothetical protein II194_07190 [Bacteroidales bacterium]|nr:hypothetical protein [Bacteroidales bacterium]
MATIVLCVLLYCSSCTTRTQDLEKIADLISIEPDTALEMLEDIDADRLAARKDKAFHSLLVSMALDKNCIDICNDSIISSALSYYSRKGAPYDRCRTFYYAARVYENGMDYEKSMEYLTKAESLSDNFEDNYLKSLIFSSKGRLYFENLEYSKAALNFNKAAGYCKEDLNIDRWAVNKTREGVCLLQERNTASADSLVKSIESHLDGVSTSTLNKYYQLAIAVSLERDDPDLISWKARYLEEISIPEMTDWLLLARVSLKEGNASEALDYIGLHNRHHPCDAGYHYIAAQALEMLGNYSQALAEYKKYDILSGKIGKSILTQDTKFIEERERHLNIHEQEKTRRVTLSLITVIVLLALAFATAVIIAARKQLKIKKLEQEDLQRQICELMLEREELASLEASGKEGRKIISERMQIIDGFVMSDAFNDKVFEHKASERLKEIIGDRSEFVRQNRLIFNQSSPEFIAYLTDHGLTDLEIEHCCLYAIGMNGKMVTSFTNVKRHYHIGSDVRKKLGLSGHDTNISIYIRNLYKELESHRPEA